MSLVVLHSFYRRERWAQKKIICPKSYLMLSDIFLVFFFCVLSGVCLPLLFGLCLPSPHISPFRHCNSNSRGRIKKKTQITVSNVDLVNCSLCGLTLTIFSYQLKAWTVYSLVI